MIRLLSLALALAILIAMVMAIQSYGGAVSIWWSDWRIDMALSTAIFSAVGLAAVLYAMFWLLAALGGLPGWWERMRQKRRERNRVAAMADLVLDFEEGRFARVTKSAQAYIDQFHDMPDARHPVERMVASLAARAAHALRDPALRDQWMARLSAAPGEKPAHPQIQALVRAEFALDDHQGEEALSVLEPLVAGDRKHVHAMRLLMKAYQQTGRWSDVLRVVRLLENRKALASMHARAIRERALDALLLDAGTDTTRVRAALGLLSGEEAAVPSTAKRVAWAWLRVGEPRQARKLIESVLAHDWDDALLEPYADCDDDIASQLLQVERWSVNRAERFELAWAKGRLCHKLGRISEATQALQRALSIRPSVRVALLLAEIAEQLGQLDEAKRYRQVASQAAESGRLLPTA
jgi:HemY protein